jgi:serine/threonine-protein kinase
MLRREAYLGRRVANPHLICVLAARVDPLSSYVVMPRLEGATVKHVLGAGGQFSVPQSLWIARQVAEALAALHAEGWIHGDVKPGNIFVSPEGHATLIDLGFALERREFRSPDHHVFVGSCRYVAPEMITSTTGHGPASDIYSLGVTLYEMLTGRSPFDAVRPAEFALAHTRQIPANPRRWVPQIPTRVAQLLQQMLAKQPLRRPHGADELVERLARLEVETFTDRTADTSCS